MAQVVQIAVELDDTGVVRGVKSIGDGLDDVGRRGKKGFEEMDRAQQRAHDATNLFARTLGVEMPRSLEKVIAQSKLIGPVMSAAFSATVVLALGAALLALVPQIKNTASSMGGFTDKLREANTEALRLNEQLLRTFSVGGEAMIATTNNEIVAINKRREALQKELETTRAVDAIPFAGLVRRVQIQREINDLRDKEALLNDRLNAQIARQGELDKETGQKAQEGAKATQAAVNAMFLAQLKGVDQIREKWAQWEREQEALGVDAGTAHAAAAAQEAAEESKYLEQVSEKTRTEYERRQKFFDDLVQKRREGLANLEDDAQKTLDAIADGETKNWNAVIAAMDKADKEHLDVLATIQKENADAATAIAAVNGDSIAQILIQEQQRKDETIAHLQEIHASEGELAQARIALDAQANAKIMAEHRNMVNTMADQLLSIWDDIANGNIGKRILNLFKRLIAQLIAQWLLGIGMMKNAFIAGQQNGTGLLGGLFGSLFSGGGGGGGGFGGIFSGLFGTQGAGGGSSAGGGFFNAFNFAGGGGSSTAAFGGSFNAFNLGGSSTIFGAAAPLSSGFGTAGAAAQQSQSNGIFGGLMSKLFGSHAQAMGQVLGGAGLGLSGIMTGLGGGGILASGLQGALGGAMTGYGLAAIAGGPVGAAVGAAIFIGSLLAGIFGGGRKKDQAIAAANSFFKPMRQTVDDYLGYKLQYDAALGQLDSIAGQAQQAMAQFGPSAGRTGMHAVTVELGKDRKTIMDTERERQKRSLVNPGTPEFETGGEFVASIRGGAGGAILHDHEIVMNQQASYKYRPQLLAMNNGTYAGGGGGSQTIVLQFLDPTEANRWLSDNVGRIRQKLQQDRINYQSA